MSDYLFSEGYVSYPDGQQNVGQVPEAVQNNGFIPETAGARGQPLPAQWLNWLFQKAFRLINRDRVSSALGENLFTIPDSVIRFEAFDRADPNKYLYAIGYKGAAGTTHTLKVIASATLTLGTATASGNQPVSGGSATVVTRGSSRQFGDI
jgi:hypothetical protein